MKRAVLITVLIALIACVSVFAEPEAKKNELVADTGFRVETDGFGFENYGSQVCEGGSSYSYFFPSGSGSCYKVTNLTTEEMVRMFGDQVCRSVDSKGNCTLTRVAEQWMNEINRIVANGHCEGMAVLSSLFYAGIEDPADFGARTTHALTLKNNPKLQREIAYWFTTQMFMDDHLIENDPNTQLKYLQKQFEKNPNVVIPVGIYTRNMSGGHAIAAYAIVDGGNGIYYIMVYDNNYPDQQKYITVDTNKNSWSYDSGTSNPWSSASSSYSGQGKNNRFQLGPIESRLGQFECDFCQTRPSYQPSSPSSNPYSPSDSSGYDSIWDILSPWISPDDSSSTPYTPSTPSDSSGYDSIWDILSPWIMPSDGGSSTPSYTPTQAPSTPSDSSGYDSIWDILSPWMSPDSDSSSQPLVRPTAIPTETPDENEYNTITVNSDINIYIETDDDERAGYDWEAEESFDEIDDVEISHTMGRTSAKMPKNLKYYMWLNSISEEGSEEWKKVDAVVTAPGSFLKLTNVPEGYTFPTLVYTPELYVADTDTYYEVFELNADPDELPGVELTITQDDAEYSFKLKAAPKGKKATPDAQVNFLIMHNYDDGSLGIWINAADGSQKDLLENVTYNITGTLSMYDAADNETTVKLTSKKPITMDMNGMFTLDYGSWLKTGSLKMNADLDGDDVFETNSVLK